MNRISAITLPLTLGALLTACVHMPPDQITLTRPQAFDLYDDDGDGVINQRDLCAQTPAGAKVDNDGCASWQMAQPKLFFVNFDLDRDVIRPDQIATLQQIIAEARNTQGSRIALVGDTSSEGSDEHNRDLGERRAATIRRYIVDAGVDPASIDAFIWTDEPVRDRLKKRERRTIVQVGSSNQVQAAPQWTVYSAEQRMGGMPAASPSK